MDELIGSLAHDALIVVLARLAGVGAVTWMVTESLPEAVAPLRRLEKPLLGLIVGPVLALSAYAAGWVEIPFALAGALGAAPEPVQAGARVGFVALLGVLSTLLARKGHDLMVGSRAARTT